VGKFYDAPRYICLGYSIGSGNGYRFIFDPNNKPCFYNNFLFPYIIAPVIKLKGIDLLTLKLTMTILSFVGIILFMKWTGLFWNKKISLYLSVLFLSSPIFIEFSDKIMTEIPFLVFLFLFFIMFENWVKTKKGIYLVALAIGLYCLIFTRIPGIAYLLGMIVYAIITKDKKLLGAGILVLLMVVITTGIIQEKVDPEDRFYHLKYLLYKNPFNPEAGFVSLGNLIERSMQNFKFYIFKIGETCIQFPHKPVLLSLLIVVIILWGIIKFSFPSKIFYLTSFSLYLFYFLIWPWRDVRFILPLYPVIIVMFFSGLDQILNKAKPRWKTICLAIVLILNFYGGYDKLIRKATIENVYPSQLREFIEMGKWMKDNLDDKSIILSSNPSLIYLLSFKKGVFLIYTSNPKKIDAYLKNNHVNYLLADSYNSETKRYIYPWIFKNKERLKIEKINGSTVLFRFRID
jgi:4-amino-4-deoxy-L-arabinose transferase-like glycosyltransferase